MLKQDNLHRGENAIHVKRHPKLGKHRTIIRGAVPLANLLLADSRVVKVNLGLMRSVWPPRKDMWFNCKAVEGKKLLKLVIMDGRAVQFLRVEVIDEIVSGKVMERCKGYFNHSKIQSSSVQ